MRMGAYRTIRDSCHSGAGRDVLFTVMTHETGVGIMTRKIKLDRYDLVIAAAFALFALVAVSLVLTS
jgi:hypothetical protein